ncbi:MAG TPA: hypothetical protein VKQ52_17550 [Puia sp.]|nr:hypothetical protein [Puia sp.]
MNEQEKSIGATDAGRIKMYQRRTQKGMGRTEKTVHNGAAKNPRLLKACNITRKRDMGGFFFISMKMRLLFNLFPMIKRTNLHSKCGFTN